MNDPDKPNNASPPDFVAFNNTAELVLDDLIDLTTDAPTTRLERDGLGPRAVPADALYGINTVRSLDTITVSSRRLRDYPDYVCALGAVKQSAIRANADAGALVGPPVRAIDRAAGRIRELDPTVIDHLVADLLAGGGSIAVHMNINEVVANLANLALGQPLGAYSPVSPKADVSASQSTADVCHTASRLAIIASSERLHLVVSQLLTTLLIKAREFADTVTLGRTCLQDGMLVPAHLLIDGSAAALTRRVTALNHSIEPLSGVTLGGTVVGTGAGAPERYRDRVVPHLCTITERNLFLHPSRASALQHSDDLVSVIAEVSSLATAAAKLAQDLRLLSSGPTGGFNEIELPHVLEGSSFFTNKRNPVVAESMISASLQIIGFEAAARAAASRAELHLNVFDNVVVVNTLDALALATTAFEQFDRHCLSDLTLNQQRCAELAAGREAGVKPVGHGDASPPSR